MAGRGRPRAFDRTAALRRAMELFWERGYEGASLSDLTAAMGIHPPSLYAAFDCKEELFKEAVAYYNATTGAAPQRALGQAPTARAAIEAVLRHNARVYVEPGHPSGCMVTLAATGGPIENEQVRRFLAACRRSDLDELRQRIERGVAEGDVPPDTDCAMLARFVAAVMHGMSLQARDGADQFALEQVADCAMAAWDRLVTDSRTERGATDGIT
jgi:AcrR family transcriptional regulator